MLNLRAKTPQLKSWLLATTMMFTPHVLATDEVTSEAQTPAETVVNGFIKDDLFVYMHVGSSKKFKILGSINASTPVSVIERNDDSGFIKVKDDRGRIGWVEQSSFTTEPSMQVKMAELQSRYDELKAISEQDQSEIARLSQQLANADNSQNESQIKITKLENQLESVSQQVALKQEEKELKQMLYGAGICIIGLILGLIIPAMAPRKRRSDHWV